MEKGPHVPTPMNLPAIPQQDEWSPQVAEQLAEERDDLGTGDVAHVEIEVQPEPVATRGHGERRDDGDLVRYGVCPTGAQVLRTLGIRRKPLSSRNARWAPRRAAFF